MKLIETLKKSGIPYFIAHSIIALVVALPFALFGHFECGLIVGVAVYVSREIAQYKYEKFFDWKGLAFPLATNLIILILT